MLEYESEKSSYLVSNSYLMSYISYCLSEVYGVYFVLIQKGCDAVGLSDMAMPDQLYLYMVGGQKRPLVSIDICLLYIIVRSIIVQV